MSESSRSLSNRRQRRIGDYHVGKKIGLNVALEEAMFLCKLEEFIVLAIKCDNMCLHANKIVLRSSCVMSAWNSKTLK